MPDYYKKVYEKYISANPEWEGKENWITRFCEKPKNRKLISEWFG